MNRVWKEASSVILASQSKSLRDRKNVLDSSFAILVLKRHSDSSVWPGHYVFPGGHTDKSDSSQEWQKIFSQSTCQMIRNCYETLNQSVTLPIFKYQEGDNIPKSVSLRIAAIRETFEESGILLCKRFEETFHDTNKHLEIRSIAQWRQKVITDASNFIKLCLENKCYPNIMALHLWSNWRTPATVPSRKFNAVFFLAVLEDCYQAFPDLIEIDEIGWYPANELLKKDAEGQVSISPPQFYELSRLLRFKDISELSSYAKLIDQSDCESMMPVLVFLDNQTVSLFPGDELYPDNAADFTFEDAELLKPRLNQCHKQHRLVVSHADATGPFEHKNLIVENVTSKFVHILPSSFYYSTNKKVPKNKL